MSWSFNFMGQKKAVAKAISDYKNGYDVADERPLVAREGRHVEAVRTAALEFVAGFEKDTAIVQVEASGSEWQGGGEFHLRVYGGADLLLNPSEPEEGQKAGD